MSKCLKSLASRRWVARTGSAILPLADAYFAGGLPSPPLLPGEKGSIPHYLEEGTKVKDSVLGCSVWPAPHGNPGFTDIWSWLYVYYSRTLVQEPSRKLKWQSLIASEAYRDLERPDASSRAHTKGALGQLTTGCEWMPSFLHWVSFPRVSGQDSCNGEGVGMSLSQTPGSMTVW